MKKVFLIILTILFLLSSAASIIGFIEHKKIVEKEIEQQPKYKITYEYYLEDTLQDNMPTNDDENKYLFSKYLCTNNITGTFDNETWTFNTKDEKDGTCKLYFVKSQYSVTLSVTNGMIEEETNVVKQVDRESDGHFTITPIEGHEYKNVSCSNDKEAIYDISTNTLTINSIMEDVACKIDFIKKKLRMDLTVKNGQGSTTVNVEYGDRVDTISSPNDGYEKPVVECTNNQIPIIEENKFIIEKLTDNTKCTITYSKIPTVTYLLKINNIPEEVNIVSGSLEQSIVSGKDGKFSLKPNEGYKITLTCDESIKPSKEEEDPDGTITYTFLSMSKNITCNVTASQE